MSIPPKPYRRYRPLRSAWFENDVFPLPVQWGEKVTSIDREQPIEERMKNRRTDPVHGALSGPSQRNSAQLKSI